MVRSTRSLCPSADAGRALAARLGSYAGRPDVIVLALPRGGVPVGAEVASSLGVDFDIVGVAKLGVPGHQELAMGAVAVGGPRVINTDVVRANQVTPAEVDAAAQSRAALLAQRYRSWRGDRPPAQVQHRVVILVDDGLATGASMRAAVTSMEGAGPARLVLAVPVGDPGACQELAARVDEVVCAVVPERFLAVGWWYEDFSQVSDEQVRALLTSVPKPSPSAAQPSGAPSPSAPQPSGAPSPSAPSAASRAGPGTLIP